MYLTGSIECIENSKNIMQNAELLYEHESYGVAQSLAILALEEVGKAVILDLANLGCISKEVVKYSMQSHAVKKIITIGIHEDDLLLGKELLNRNKQYLLDKKQIKLLGKKDVFKKLEKKRQIGLYVNVDSEKGDIISTPSNINSKDAKFIINKIKIYLEICETLCEIFRDFNKRPRTSLVIMNIDVPENIMPEYEGELEDHTITIMFDEI